MKKFLLILTITLCSLTAFAQTQTKKWNSILNRYEYYQGDRMIAYEVYNSILGQWERYTTDQQRTGVKEDWDVISPYDTDAISRAIQQKQAAYDRNYAAILQAVTRLNTAIQNANGLTTQQQANIDKFYQWLNQVCQGDLSDNSLTNNIIYSINNKINEVNKWKKTPTQCEDGTIYNTPDGKEYICHNGKLVEYNYDPMTGKPVNSATPKKNTTPAKPNLRPGTYEVDPDTPVRDKDSALGKEITKANGKVTVLYKSQNDYYRVRLSNGTEGYISSLWIKQLK